MIHVSLLDHPNERVAEGETAGSVTAIAVVHVQVFCRFPGDE